MARYRAVEEAGRLAEKQVATLRKAMERRKMTRNRKPAVAGEPGTGHTGDGRPVQIYKRGDGGFRLKFVPGDAPPAPEVLQQAIVDLAEAWKRFTGTRVRRTTLVTLLHEASGVGKRDILAVLDALDDFETHTLKPTDGLPTGR